MSKRILLLFGAGATIPWGGKTSESLTSDVLKTNIKHLQTKKSNEPIGFFLQKLLKDYYQVDQMSDINFELVLEAIEYLFSYFRNKEFTNPIWARTVFPALFNVEENLLEDIPEESPLNQIEYDSFQKKSVTLIEVYKEILRNLCTNVHYYISRIDTQSYEIVNSLFCKFINSLTDSGTVRGYTLNYDDFLLKQNCIKSDFFNGFTKENDYRYDYKRIISGLNIHCIYNLHGSFHFHEQPSKDFRIIELSYKPGIPDVHNLSTQIPLLNFPVIPFPIITGNYKLSKTLIQPMDAFNHVFRYDCFNSDEIIIIGYSFNDPHINNIISTSITHNKDISLKIITKISESNSYNFISALIRALKYNETEIKNAEINSKPASEIIKDKLVIYSDGFLNSHMAS